MNIIEQFPDLQFEPGETFMWSPTRNAIFYDPDLLKSHRGKLALLHEIGHALLEHLDFDHDMELMQMEMDAWDKARELARDLGIKIDEDHIDTCIESYRIWLHSRSRCPDCDNTGSQTENDMYYCFICGCTWKVPASQAKRTLRKKL